MQICIFEDHLVSNFYPLVYFRPVHDLRCGARSLAEKILDNFPRTKVILHVRRSIAQHVSEERPEMRINSLPDDDVWLVNGRILADDSLRTMIRKPSGRKLIFVKNNDVAAAYVPRSDVRTFSAQLTGELFSLDAFSGWVSQSYEGTMLAYPWECVHHNPDAIEQDFRAMKLKKKIAGKLYPGVHLLNRTHVVIGNATVIKPGVVLDAEKGPIVIGRNVTVMSNAVIEGPVYIGDHSVIKIGAKIYHGTSIGEWCKVGGEVDASIIHSYSNKQHDGFLGHSFVGSWVNIGADTNTSDLKNTYGNVKVHVGSRLIDSNMQFVGLTIGDHSKTGINVMFDTGTVVGASCNIYGAGLPPKFMPSFTWGEKGGFSQFSLEKSIEIARRVMARRSVTMSTAYERVMREIFAATESDRRAAGIN